MKSVELEQRYMATWPSLAKPAYPSLLRPQSEFLKVSEEEAGLLQWKLSHDLRVW